MADDMNMQIIIESQNQTGPGFDEMNTAMESFQRLISEVTRAFDDFTRSVDQGARGAAEAIQSINKPVEEVAQQLSIDFEGPAKNAEEQLSKIGEGLRTVTSEAETAANNVTKDFQKAAEESENALKNVGKGSSDPKSSGKKDEGLLGMSGQMDMMYAGMTLGAMAAPLDLGLEKSIAAFADFDQSMRLVNQEMKLSEGGFNDLEGSIVSLSNQTGISANDLSQGLYNVVATGLTDTKQAMEELTVAAEGAKAGHTDLNTATKALNAVMGAYGLTSDQASHIMDVMFTGVNNGQMHFDELARSVGASATAAATAGVSYEELSSAQATLTNVGKNAEVASMNLNSLIMGIIAPTSQATKEAAKLGIEWDAGALKAHGLTYMINEAMKATGGNTEELKKLLPNQRAYIAELALGGKAHEQYNQTLDQMKNSTGATAKALEEFDKGTGESLEKAKTAIQNAGMALVAGLEPAITSVSNAISKLSTWFQTLSPNTQKLIGEIAIGAAAFLTLGGSLFMALSGFGALNSGLLGIAKSFGLVQEGAKMLDLMKLLVNPWTLAIGAAIVVVYEIVTHWTQIKAFLEATWKAISDTATAVWNGITSFFQKWGVDILAAIFPVLGIPLLIYQHWSQITQFANQIWTDVTNLVTQIWSSFVNWIDNAAQTMVNTVVGWFSWLYNHNYYFKDLVDSIKKAWDMIKQDATTIWNGITTFFSTVWTNIFTGATTAWNSFKTTMSTLWNGIISALKTIWNPISTFFLELWDGISSTASDTWNSITLTMSGLWQGIVNNAENIFNSLGNFFSDLWNQAYNWGANLIHMIAQGIQNAAHEVEQAASNVAHSIASFLGFHSPAEEGPGSDADMWAPNLINMFAGGIFDGASAVSSAAEQMMKPLRASMAAVMASGIGDMSSSFVGSMAHTVAIAGGGGGRSSSPVYNVYVQGNIARNERELGQIVAREIWTQTKMQGKF